MSCKIYMDVHVPLAVTLQLRQRGIDVLTAIEDDREEAPDHELLGRASELGRVTTPHSPESCPTKKRPKTALTSDILTSGENG